MNLIEVDPARCTSCGTCVKACPVGILVLEGYLPSTVAKIEKGCIACGHCVAACPPAALRHRRMRPEECAPLKPGWRLTPAQVAQLVRGRRSIRSYRRQPIDPAVMAEAMDVIRHAPTGMNSQSISWKVILDEQEVQFLSLAVVEWLRTLEGSPVPGVKGALKAWEMGRDPILRKAPGLVVAHGAANDPAAGTSATIALATLELVAPSFGLGTCWTGFLHMAAASSPEVLGSLALPVGHRMCGGLIIGYPELEYARVPTRNPARVIWE